MPFQRASAARFSREAKRAGQRKRPSAKSAGEDAGEGSRTWEEQETM